MPYVKCTRCEHVYIREQIDPDELIYLYSQRRSHHNSPVKVAWDYSDLKDKCFYSHLIKKINKFSDTGKLLDIGCSNGSFAFAAQNRGWQVLGIELEEASRKVAEAHGLKLLQGELRDQNLPNDHFDAITMWNVLEHFSDPKEVVQEIYRILKPGGVCAICVPNIKSIGWLLLREQWDSVEPQIHMNLFSPQTLKRFMNNQDFTTKYIETIDMKPATIKAWLGSMTNKSPSKQTNSIAQIATESNSKMKWMLRLRGAINIPLRIMHWGEDLYGYFQK